MRQALIPKYGPPETLTLVEKADPRPKRGEVLIAVQASGVNFADIMARKGLYAEAPKPPMVVGYEVSGTVAAVGEDVILFEEGQEVIALTRFNGYADKVCAPHEQVFIKPDKLSFAQAAAIPVNYLTAYQLMVTQGSLKSQESVLIHNAGGGVGLAALDFATELGALSYGTASAHKGEFLKERGLSYFIDYRKEDWFAQLMDLTMQQGVELILDPLGANNWKKSYKALRATGRLGLFGVSSMTKSGLPRALAQLREVINMPFYHPIALLNANRSVFGVNLGRLWHEGAKIRGWMQNILAGVKKGWIRPHVGKIFPLAEAGAAHQFIEQRKNIGKVILSMEA